MRDKQIIVFSGKKFSGKSTLANYICVKKLQNYGYNAELTEDGKILCGGKIDLSSGIHSGKSIRKVLDPYIKQFAFADPIKETCMKLFNLTYEQCYGTDEEKNTLTPYMKITTDCSAIGEYFTAREFMQFFGTDVCRKIYDNIWLDACVKSVVGSESKLCLITDCRFPSEVTRMQQIGAKVIRLKRETKKDGHYSETALDDYSDHKFDAVIDNRNMTQEESVQTLVQILKKWNIYDNYLS